MPVMSQIYAYNLVHDNGGEHLFESSSDEVWKEKLHMCRRSHTPSTNHFQIYLVPFESHFPIILGAKN
jgi:hypothetical protein